MRTLSRHLSVLLLCGVSVVAACSGDPSFEAPAESASARTYSIRGVVRQLPAAAGVPLLIEHEAIPDFVDVYGKSSPMASMTMPFEVGDPALLVDLAPGDKVAFELRVDWQAPRAMEIVSVTRLPHETSLALEKPTSDEPSG